MESAGVRTPVIAVKMMPPRSSIVIIACFLRSREVLLAEQNQVRIAL
jgi:hypothetical protein